MNSFFRGAIATAAAAVAVSSVHAIPQTRSSPAGGELPAAVTEIGGIVLDLVGLNTVRLVAQLPASTLFVGTPAAGLYPLLIGTQTGFTPALLSALGGGLTSVAVRVTLFDGDNQSGNFDFNDNTFLVDGITIGNWSDVATDVTSGDGMTSFGLGTGFGDSELATGFFSLTDSLKLASLFGALGDGSLAFTLDDVDPTDNFYDFTQGVDGGLINVGTGPVIQPPVGAVPEPATWAMMIGGFGMAGGSLRYRRRKTSVSFA